MKKENYVTPRIEVIEVENEGSVMSMSYDGEVLPSTTRSAGSATKNTTGTSSAFSDLEDLINDLFTVKK